MTHNAPSHWQPVQVSAATNEPGSSPSSSLNSRTNTSFSSDLKRLGASLSWKSWKSSKSRTGSETNLSTLSTCNHGWKPNTMRKRVLVPMAILMAVLASVIEILAQRSIREGGLSLSRTADGIPDIAEFKYEFLPTIIAVILSIAWTWVDLDVKRIQPWLEMSREGGVKVQDSLILDYPYDFVALVPFKAAKRRHWSVFVSGTVMVLIFWVITPLQGAIFGKGAVQIREPTSFYASQDLLPLADQSKAIDTSILHHMYAIKFLDQPYPPFTTPEYALRPFKLETETKPGAKNWTAKTMKFWTDLSCEPAEISKYKWEGYYDYDNGKGCNASGISTIGSNPEYNYQLYYLTWHNSAYASQSFGTPTCPSQFSNQFLAITSKGTLKDSNITALFCETSYWKQRVSVTVPDNGFHPNESSTIPDGPVEELPISEFNSTGFEYLLGTSVSEVQSSSRLRDYPDNLIMNLFDRFNNSGVQFPISPMVGFAVGGMERSIEDYRDASVMREAYRAIHQSTFALAYSALLTEETASKEKTEGSIEFVMHGVIVSRVFSAIVEGLLLAVGVCCFILLALSARAKSNLSANPATLGDQMNLLRSSYGLLDIASQDRRILKEKISTEAETAKLHLQCACDSPDGSPTITVIGTASLPPSPRTEDKSTLAAEQDDQYTPIRPLALRRSSGLVFSILLAASLAGLLALRVEEQRLNGLQRPTDKFEILQLLENYIPTAIATLIEPYWVLVNRLLCVFQPYNDLQKTKKGSQAKGAMRARYASLPPQLSVWSAARSGHILLSTVCVIALMGNVLAVGLGGLFNEEPIRTSYPMDFQFQKSHQFDSINPPGSLTTGRIHDNFFSLKANMTFGTRMPPWVVHDYHFQPFTTSSPSEQNSTEIFSGRTRGYGVDVDCDELKPYAREGEEDVMDLRPVRERYGTSPLVDCPDFWNITSGDYIDGPSAIEGARHICNVVIVYWGRSVDNATADREMEYHSCRPKFKTALFDISIDALGHVFDYNRTSGFDDDLGYDQSRNHTDALLDMSATNVGMGSGDWHNDTFSHNWLGDILKASGEGWFLDPSESLPEPSKVLPLVEEFWRRTFAYMLANPDLANYAALEEDQPPFTGTRLVTETRIFMSDVAFIVSAIVFSLYIAVAVVLYTLPIMPPLPRMPTSIGAVLQFTAPSRAIREYTPESQAHLRFGRYIGLDGKKNVGIEYSELVMPVNLAAAKSGRGLHVKWLRRPQRDRNESVREEGEVLERPV